MSEGEGWCHVQSFVERLMEGEWGWRGGDRALQVTERALTDREGVWEHHRRMRDGEEGGRALQVIERGPH